MQLFQAQLIALQLVTFLFPHCSKVDIAGSIRRKKDEVGDIEIVCCPNKEATGQASMFAEATEYARTKDFHELVKCFGVIETGNPDGRMMKILLPAGIKLDLFMPQDFDYYRQLAIRTGSSTYSNLVLAHAWKRKGWCGTEHGLRKIIDCKKLDEKRWKLINPAGERPPYWTSEEEFFDWLGLKWVEPYLRDVQSTESMHQKIKLNH